MSHNIKMYKTTDLNEAAVLHSKGFKVDFEKDGRQIVFCFEDGEACEKISMQILNREALVNVYEFINSRSQLISLTKDRR